VTQFLTVQEITCGPPKKTTTKNETNTESETTPLETSTIANETVISMSSESETTPLATSTTVSETNTQLLTVLCVGIILLLATLRRRYVT